MGGRWQPDACCAVGLRPARGGHRPTTTRLTYVAVPGGTHLLRHRPGAERVQPEHAARQHRRTRLVLGGGLARAPSSSNPAATSRTEPEPVITQSELRQDEARDRSSTRSTPGRVVRRRAHHRQATSSTPGSSSGATPTSASPTARWPTSSATATLRPSRGATRAARSPSSSGRPSPTGRCSSPICCRPT